MKPLQIKHAIERAGSTQREIARACGVSTAMVNMVIWRGVVSLKVHREIARTIGKPLDEIWPDRYGDQAAA